MMNNHSTATDLERKSNYFKVAPGVWGLKVIFVNLYMIAKGPGSKEWVLVDAGLRGSSKKIRRMAEELFGPNNPPAAIILTHGHFDHTGSLKNLLKYWHVPVYAHSLEMPYLTGKSAYPPPDPMAGGGLMSTLSWTFPKGPINLGSSIKPLPDNGEVPELGAWTYYHTPGHAPGHISLFRASDGVLIAGDAFVTTRQESVFAALTQKKHLSGPPKYFTNDWGAAEKSVKLLAHLQPATAATGHGVPMMGEELTKALNKLAMKFQKKAVPKHGRYVESPAVMNANGVQYVPPEPFNPMLGASIFALAALSAYSIISRIQSRRD